ncbi:MAG: class I SAM-dependent methyltransferase [Sphaerochaeta sp.]|nr:class I SAM-dependent methyltransferase [Sphaerochaeta sp.]
MHDNSMKLMREFVEEYDLEKTVVLDMGSQDFNGSYRDLFRGGYIGADIVKGANVDVLIGSPLWNLLGPVDLIISGQTIEHVSDIPGFMAEIYKKLNPDGLLCVIAPSAGPEHHYPVWSGHFSIERMTQIFADAGFVFIECEISDVEPFKDCRCIARKPEKNENQ